MWLALVALLVVIFVAIYLKPTKEGFNAFLTSQRDFADKQRVYYSETANKGIFVNPGLRLDGLNEAVAQTDYDLPINKLQDFTGFFMEDPAAGWNNYDNKFCSNAKHPRDLPPIYPNSSVSCGWWFFEDPNTASIGAIGTAMGPALPDNLPRGGTWIWSRAEAEMYEDIKKCKTVKSCEFIGLEDVRNECAFCRDKGHGVPITSTGELKYPDNTYGSCGTQVIRDPAKCVEPEQSDESLQDCGIGGRPSSDGSKRLYTAEECSALDGVHQPGDICVRPDDGGNFSIECAGLNVKASPGCPMEGTISKDCVLELALKNNFSDTGALVKLIRSGTMSTMLQDAIKTLRSNSVDVPEMLWKNTATANAANRALRTIANEARRNTNKSIRLAAQYLIDGKHYNPCDVYASDTQGPFDTECLQRAFRSAGCQAGGTAYPNQRTAVSELSNMTWSQVNEHFKKIHNDMQSTERRKQTNALKKCLGVGSEFYNEPGQTCWKCSDDVLTPIRRNANDAIECASYDGRNCLWRTTKKECEETIHALSVRNLDPVKCDTTSYDNPDSWCAKAEASGLHESPVVVRDAVMYGPWIKGNRRTIKKKLNDGRTVYILSDEIYTKMVTEDKEEKYYVGPMSRFDPNQWNSYTNTSGGKYLLRFYDRPLNKAKEGYMYGKWVNNGYNRAHKRKLNDGQTVYLIEQTPYTKMATESGEERYYVGTINDFNPNNWNSYTETEGGDYLMGYTDDTEL